MNNLNLRRPRADDGPALHRLVKRCQPLDENSRYCNLLQVTHFRDTAIVAERDGELCGFVTGYRVPGRDHVLFVWQVGVSPEGRGQGLARRMLTALIQRVEGISLLETTVTPDNVASRTVFEQVARSFGVTLRRWKIFDSKIHFDDKHDEEVLYRIGPFTSADAQVGNYQLGKTGT